ncbi:MAG TPA: hypothetical protein VI489_05575 [Candidatus Brocadiaceae bacterium]
MFNILLPAMLSGAGFLFVWFLEKRGKRGVKWVISLGILLGYMIGYVGIQGLPQFPPSDPSTGWFVYIGLATLILSLAESGWKNRWWIVIIGRAIFTLLVCLIMLSPLVRYTWSMPETILRVATFTVISLIFWNIIDSIRKALSPGLLGLFLTIFATASSIVILLSHSILLAQLVGLVAATMGAITAVNWVFPRVSSDSTMTGLVSVLIIIHAMSAVSYADMPGWSALLLAAAPAAALLIWQRGQSTKERLFGFLVSLAIEGIAIVLTFITLS